ncbi:glycerol kinase [Labrys miyagiensis]|uniref:ATP:glycerol 3-phosphotransferase n=1 Tax=Labrys miyagiensis TaxID=346912 RepID=A0ABQ6CSN5_9HYPH|nr:FGGY family carbohydrate kinase [Labrys miyagiensis]GLS21749.1 glycerol kinase [Labrys miyagiensis]
MAGPLVLAIDQGTSSTKCLLVDGSGAVVARGQASLSESHPRPGWVEQDARQIWASVKSAVAACVSPDLASRVVAAGISTQRESCLLWDRKTGAPFSPVLSWQDQRTSALAQEIGAPDTLAMVRRVSGLPLDPMFSALKLTWLLDELDPDRVKARAGDILFGTIDSWLLSRLSGEHLIEAGNASRTQLLDVMKGCWNQDLLDLFRVPAQALPQLTASTGPFPTLRGLAPLPDGIPVLAVMADSHSALFAHGAIAPGEAKATQGTGSSVMGLVAGSATLDPGLCLTIAWAIDGTMPDKLALAAEGNIRAAGSTLRWASSILGVTTDELAALAKTAPSNGVALVPGFNGLGAPWWDAEATGLLTGLTLSTDRKAIARAALDSIAHQIADVVEALDRSGTRLRRLHVDGGPTRNDQLMQMEADMIGRPILRGHTAELSALGVAHLAGFKAGLWDTKTLAALERPHDVFEPGMEACARDLERRHWLDAVARSRLRPAGGA